MPDLDFMYIVADLLFDMRLLVEGAITLYEEDLAALITPAAKAEKPEAHIALSDIGGALYDLRRHVKRLQMACYNETHRQVEPDV